MNPDRLQVVQADITPLAVAAFRAWPAVRERPAAVTPMAYEDLSRAILQTVLEKEA